MQDKIYVVVDKETNEVLRTYYKFEFTSKSKVPYDKNTEKVYITTKPDFLPSFYDGKKFTNWIDKPKQPKTK